MSAVTSLATHVAAPVDYVLMRGLLSQARKCLPYFNGTVAGTLEQNGGSMSVKWRRFDDLAPATTALGEITGDAAFQMGRTAATATVTDLTVAIAKYGNFINHSEELDLFNVNSRAAQLMDVLGRNAGESLNVLARNIMDGAVNIRYSGGVAATTSLVTALSINDVRYVVNQLNRNSAMKFFSMGTGSQNVGSSPVRSSYFGICHSDVEEDVRQLSGFIGVEQYGGYIGDVQIGEFGAVGGVRFCSTEIAPLLTSSATKTATGFRGASNVLNDVYKTFIYGREAVGTVGLGEEHAEEIYRMGDRPAAIQIINKPVGSSGIADPLNEVGSIAWKAWFAGKVLNDAWIREVQTLSSELA